jgi:hypothetical protein
VRHGERVMVAGQVICRSEVRDHRWRFVLPVLNVDNFPIEPLARDVSEARHARGRASSDDG